MIYRYLALMNVRQILQWTSALSGAVKLCFNAPPGNRDPKLKPTDLLLQRVHLPGRPPRSAATSNSQIQRTQRVSYTDGASDNPTTSPKRTASPPRPSNSAPTTVHPRTFDFFVPFASHTASALGMPLSKLVHLPTQRRLWTVLRGRSCTRSRKRTLSRGRTSAS
ncbi:hypothetical protein L226DRAFT_142141 [Lentinus tigrinus ALCF2SS1-7]|uniref:Small ribosomal subunit protein uS10 domain-containing protein n=1 Tax=Lentinus tigrinus ALCF2SS1-6 TaxID=1328759 RepID=A0A5C2S3Z4_9APHY|nr:hypothetical protein L227DRAFT_191547 [Lentinus tigrinus ALCF2SS1-6]RPD72963.1 hypothetical protein L226DRAFT_142141 [Lentinus tigrinus ALCF2SS1-7]